MALKGEKRISHSRNTFVMMSLLNCHLLLMTYFIVVATRHCTSMITKGETDLRSLRELWYVPFLVVGKREREREREGRDQFGGCVVVAHCHHVLACIVPFDLCLHRIHYAVPIGGSVPSSPHSSPLLIIPQRLSIKPASTRDISFLCVHSQKCVHYITLHLHQPH